MTRKLLKQWGGMMSDYIEYSMDFAPLFDNSEYESFYIEKSPIYGAIRNQRVSSVEFVVKRNSRLSFIEAKNTFKKASHEEFEKDLQSTYDKFVHSFFLFTSQRLGLGKNMDEAFNIISITPVERVVFLLVINEHEHHWCKALKNKIKEKFTRDFHPLNKILNWEVIVINSSTARKRKIIA